MGLPEERSAHAGQGVLSQSPFVTGVLLLHDNKTSLSGAEGARSTSSEVRSPLHIHICRNINIWLVEACAKIWFGVDVAMWFQCKCGSGAWLSVK
jgi:hypothetical protein